MIKYITEFEPEPAELNNQLVNETNEKAKQKQKKKKKSTTDVTMAVGLPRARLSPTK